jgi:hypothetical protein
VYAVDSCKTEAELLEYFKKSYLHEDRGETCEETSIGGRRALKITIKERMAPAPLHDNVTQFGEAVKYLVILESPTPHAGFAYLVVDSVIQGAAPITRR